MGKNRSYRCFEKLTDFCPLPKPPCRCSGGFFLLFEQNTSRAVYIHKIKPPGDDMPVKFYPTFVLYTCAWLFLGSCQNVVNQMAFHPDTHSTIPAGELPESVREIFITTRDGIKLHSYFLADSSSVHLLIYFHGNAGNLSGRLSDLQRIHHMGINVLGVEYRGYGRSTGRATETGIYEDGRAALAYARNNRGFPDSTIFLLGRSLGSTVAIHSAQNRKMAGIILVSPLSSAREQAGAMGLGFMASMAGNAFNNLEKARYIICPVLVIHGTADRVIPVEMGRALYKALPAPKYFTAIDGAGHNNLSTAGAPVYWPAIREFINPGKREKNLLY